VDAGSVCKYMLQIYVANICRSDVANVWYHFPSEILPKGWSCNWLNFDQLCLFMVPCSTYDMGDHDIIFKTAYGIKYPIKGVMYSRFVKSWRDDYFIFRDATGHYYFWNDHIKVPRMRRFKVPLDTSPENFVKNFRGIRGGDMDVVNCLPEWEIHHPNVLEEQLALARLRDKLHPRCACMSRCRPVSQAHMCTYNSIANLLLIAALVQYIYLDLNLDELSLCPTYAFVDGPIVKT
jgi:hypothetical protein